MSASADIFSFRFFQRGCVLLGALGLLVFGGCASVSVRSVDVEKPPVRQPAAIAVVPFTFAAGEIDVDREGDALKEFEAEFSGYFAEVLAERLSRFVAPAQVVEKRPDRPAAGTWIVEGEFTRIEQGSRLLRASVGLGLGGTKLETRSVVSVVQANRKFAPFLKIETTGGTNAEPGGLVGPLFTIPLRIATQASSGLNRDATRTARMITAAVQSESRQRGLNPAGRPIRPKPLGRLPIGTSGSE
ncbi:MAG: DUF4410 domain-containing protein [Terrimicrobiaceae bacterium]|nr:DUF4410 domain-containing protein [Terrimicrobiaceae bacterium]